MSNAAVLAEVFDRDYLGPTIDWWIDRQGTPVKVDYVKVISVSGSYATVQYRNGSQTSMPFGKLTPVAGEVWRSIRIYKGAARLDDVAFLAAPW